MLTRLSIRDIVLIDRLDIDFAAGPIDHLVGSSNKCVEGVPGFSFIISRRAAIHTS